MTEGSQTYRDALIEAVKKANREGHYVVLDLVISPNAIPILPPVNLTPTDAWWIEMGLLMDLFNEPSPKQIRRLRYQRRYNRNRKP